MQRSKQHNGSLITVTLNLRKATLIHTLTRVITIIHAWEERRERSCAFDIVSSFNLPYWQDTIRLMITTVGLNSKSSVSFQFSQNLQLQSSRICCMIIWKNICKMWFVVPAKLQDKNNIYFTWKIFGYNIWINIIGAVFLVSDIQAFLSQSFHLFENFINSQINVKLFWVNELGNSDRFVLCAFHKKRTKYLSTAHISPRPRIE